MKCTQCGSNEFIDAKEVFVEVNTTCNCLEGGGRVNCISGVSVGDLNEVEQKDLWGKNTYVKISNQGFLQAFVCKKCGHVEFFCNTYLLEEQEKQAKLKAEQERIEHNNKIQEDINKNNKRINELNKLIEDENITVKQQKEYIAEREHLKESNKALAKQKQ